VAVKGGFTVFRPRLFVLFRRAWTTAAAIVATACAGGGSDEHPWIRLDPASPHRIIEFSGADAGQVVIAADPTISREEALALGRLIQSQAPPGAILNVRVYNDEATARGWRTAPADLHVSHLLVIVSSSSATGSPEVRWVRPDSLDAFPGATQGPLPTDSSVQEPLPPDSIQPSPGP
jgi:hypothetical protein